MSLAPESGTRVRRRSPAPESGARVRHWSPSPKSGTGVRHRSPAPESGTGVRHRSPAPDSSRLKSRQTPGLEYDNVRQKSPKWSPVFYRTSVKVLDVQQSPVESNKVWGGVQWSPMEFSQIRQESGTDSSVRKRSVLFKLQPAPGWSILEFIGSPVESIGSQAESIGSPADFGRLQGGTCRTSRSP